MPSRIINRENSRAQKIAHQIDLQRAVEIPQREVANKRRLGDPGAVHQQVDAREKISSTPWARAVTLASLVASAPKPYAIPSPYTQR